VRAVETLPSGRFKVRYRYAGRESSQTFADGKQAARFSYLVDVLGGPQAALDQLHEERTIHETPTLDDIAADHIRLLTSVTEGTRLTYERLWARTWGPLIGRLPANLVTRDKLAEATNTLSRSYSAKSLKNQRGLLAAVCARAVELRYLSTNPTRGLRLPRAGEEGRVEMRVLTPAEFAGILERTHRHYQPLVRFLAGTGARWGEAVALQVADVALPNVRIRRGLKWSPDNKRTIGPTKTRRSNRTVALPSEVQTDVALLIAERPGDALVFTAPRGGPIQHRTFWSDIWLPAVQHLLPRPRIHDLRHSHAAWLLAGGVPPHIVQARLGHESIKTTVDTYGGLLPDAQVAAAAAADAVFGVRAAELG
jgi:integrase